MANMMYYMSKIDVFMYGVLILSDYQTFKYEKGEIHMKYGVSILISVLLLSVVLSLVLMKSIHGDGNALPKYDERQKVVRGRGYMFAFYITLIIYCAIPFTLQDDAKKYLGDMLFFGPALLGILIHVSYCIWQNAYVELNTEFKKCVSVITATSILNLWLGLLAIADGRMVKEGALQFPALSVMVGVVGMLIVIEMIVKRALDKRGDADEESEA